MVPYSISYGEKPTEELGWQVWVSGHIIRCKGDHLTLCCKPQPAVSCIALFLKKYSNLDLHSFTDLFYRLAKILWRHRDDDWIPAQPLLENLLGLCDPSYFNSKNGGSVWLQGGGRAPWISCVFHLLAHFSKMGSVIRIDLCQSVCNPPPPSYMCMSYKSNPMEWYLEEKNKPSQAKPALSAMCSYCHICGHFSNFCCSSLLIM